MGLYNFKKRFVPMILSGDKRHTIREKRKRRAMPGEVVHLYTGLRQKGAQLLIRSRCTKVQDITIAECERCGGTGEVCYSSMSYGSCEVFAISVDGGRLDQDECERLARADGFASFSEMMQFWDGRLPFNGDIIHWNFPPDVWGVTQRTQSGEMGKCANVSGQDAPNLFGTSSGSVRPIVDEK